MGEKINSEFYILFGQIGATILSILASLFIGYLFYLREQRDRIKNNIYKLKLNIDSIIRQIEDIPILNVTDNIYYQDIEKVEKEIEKENEGSDLDLFQRRIRHIFHWADLFSWEKQAENIGVEKIWEDITIAFEKLFKNLLPRNFNISLSNSENFQKWAEYFLRETYYIEIFDKEHKELNGFSWLKALLSKMKRFESDHSNPDLTSQNVSILLGRILELRNLTDECLDLEYNYQYLKIDKVVSDYKIVIFSFLMMGTCSIILPLIILLNPITLENSIIAYLNLVLFIVFTLLGIGILVRSANK